MAEGNYRSIRSQKQGLSKTYAPLRKYIQGQRVYCDYLPYEVAPESVVKTPSELYKLLKDIGFVWDTKRCAWRVDKRRKKLKSYFGDEDYSD